MEIVSANRIAPDGTSRFAASHLGLFCLPMPHKKNARLTRVWVNTVAFRSSPLLCKSRNIYVNYVSYLKKNHAALGAGYSHRRFHNVQL